MKRTPHALDFSIARAAFIAGTDDPRAYLERCIETIDERNGEVRAFITLGLESARRAADASAQRYRKGAPLSAVDGMPLEPVMDSSVRDERAGRAQC